jgi:hypothetical protein
LVLMTGIGMLESNYIWKFRHSKLTLTLQSDKQ